MGDGSVGEDADVSAVKEGDRIAQLVLERVGI